MGLTMLSDDAARSLVRNKNLFLHRSRRMSPVAAETLRNAMGANAPTVQP